MFGFGGMTSFNSEWKLVNMIENSTLSVDQLLDDESIISIAKNNNSEIMSFITQPKNFHEILSHLISLPQDFSGPADVVNPVTQQNKLPFIACELLSSEIAPIMNKLLGIPSNAQSDTDTIRDDSFEGSDSESKKLTFPCTADQSKENDVSQSKEVNDSVEEQPNNSDEYVESLDDYLIQLKKQNQNLMPTNSQQYNKPQENNAANIQQLGSDNKSSKSKQILANSTSDLEQYPSPMEFLLGFFSNSAPLNPTMCGYVSKVLKNLFLNKTTEFSDLIFDSLFSNFKKLLNHLYNDSLCQFLDIFIKMDNLPLKEPFHLKKRSEVVLLLINMFSTPQHKVPLHCDLAADYLSNIGNLLVGWMNSYKNINCGQELLKSLSRSVYVNPLVFLIEKAENAQLKAISEYITAYCFFFRMVNVVEDNDTVQDSPQSPSNLNIANNELTNFYSANKSASNSMSFLINDNHADQNEPVLIELSRIASRTLDILRLNEQNQTVITFPGGYSATLTGRKRYYLVDMLGALMKLNHPPIEKILIKENFYHTLLDLFKQECWNNILHCLLFKTLTFVIESKALESSKTILFKQAKILEYIISELQDQDHEHDLKNVVEKGYIAHIWKLANSIASTDDEKTRAYTKEEHIKSQWSRFCSGPLREYNSINNTILGGTHPKSGESNSHSIVGPMSYGINDFPDTSEQLTNEQDIYQPEHEKSPDNQHNENSNSNSISSDGDKMDIEEQAEEKLDTNSNSQDSNSNISESSAGLENTSQKIDEEEPSSHQHSYDNNSNHYIQSQNIVEDDNNHNHNHISTNHKSETKDLVLEHSNDNGTDQAVLDENNT